MLTRRRTHSGSNQITEPAAFVSERGEWHFDEDWEVNAPYWIDRDGKNERDTTNAHFEKFFPLHSTCADILQRFTHHQSLFQSSNLPKSVKEFFDACVACQRFSNEEYIRICTYNRRDTRPPDYGRYGCVDWSHIYFGARRFWADPWDCVPGHEYLCANPMSDSQIDRLVTRYLARPKSSSQHLFLIPINQAQVQESAPNESPLMRCPTEILRSIAFHLPLRSAINFHASSHRLSTLIVANESDFWRSHTLRLHGPWFWELWDHQGSSGESSSYRNWEELLKMLSLSRRKIMEGAQPYWLEPPGNESIDTASKHEHNNDEDAPSLSLRLCNRQRIWMCLESLDIDGKSKPLEVDKKGRVIRRPLVM